MLMGENWVSLKVGRGSRREEMELMVIKVGELQKCRRPGIARIILAESTAERYLSLSSSGRELYTRVYLMFWKSFRWDPTLANIFKPSLRQFLFQHGSSGSRWRCPNVHQNFGPWQNDIVCVAERPSFLQWEGSQCQKGVACDVADSCQ